VQTKRDIQNMLAAAGVRPLKRFGQHFLIDGNLMRKLVAAAELRPDDVVLEVGPGTGALTRELTHAAGYVVAVEIDNTLQALCRRMVDQPDKCTVIHGDILERKTSIAPDVLKELSARQRHLGGRILLVANLPYQVATPLIIELLLGELPVSPMCFTVQAEVADRFLAVPGGKDYGPVSIYTRALATVRRIVRVPPEAFWPVPEVHSAMLHVDVCPERRPAGAVLEQLTSIVRGCFNHRRKTMRANLRSLLDTTSYVRVESDGRWDLTLRPELLDVDQWIALAVFLAQYAE